MIISTNALANNNIRFITPMLDSFIRPVIERPLQICGKYIAGSGLSATMITAVNFVLVPVILGIIMTGQFTAGFCLILINRFLDGLDGAVARAHVDGESDFGGFLDIVSDFILYAGVIFSFAVYDTNMSVAAAFLLFSYMGTSSSFLAYAIMAAKHNIRSEKRGRKAFAYLGGLTEGSETIIVMLLMCLFPTYFTLIAVSFGVMCWLTTFGRIAQGWRDFRL